MTEYTKTQLIDMAIDKLGEKWLLDNYYTHVFVSTEPNVIYGFGHFSLNLSNIVVGNWQLVCTRDEFEQHIAQRKHKCLDNLLKELVEDMTDEKVDKVWRVENQIIIELEEKLTERQQAGLKLWRAINYNDPMTDDEVLGYCRFEDYCRPFDQGLLK